MNPFAKMYQDAELDEEIISSDEKTIGASGLDQNLADPAMSLAQPSAKPESLTRRLPTAEDYAEQYATQSPEAALQKQAMGIDPSIMSAEERESIGQRMDETAEDYAENLSFGSGLKAHWEKFGINNDIDKALREAGEAKDEESMNSLLKMKNDFNSTMQEVMESGDPNKVEKAFYQAAESAPYMLRFQMANTAVNAAYGGSAKLITKSVLAKTGTATAEKGIIAMSKSVAGRFAGKLASKSFRRVLATATGKAMVKAGVRMVATDAVLTPIQLGATGASGGAGAVPSIIAEAVQWAAISAATIWDIVSITRELTKDEETGLMEMKKLPLAISPKGVAARLMAKPMAGAWMADQMNQGIPAEYVDSKAANAVGMLQGAIESVINPLSIAGPSAMASRAMVGTVEKMASKTFLKATFTKGSKALMALKIGARATAFGATRVLPEMEEEGAQAVAGQYYINKTAKAYLASNPDVATNAAIYDSLNGMANSSGKDMLKLFVDETKAAGPVSLIFSMMGLPSFSMNLSRELTSDRVEAKELVEGTHNVEGLDEVSTKVVELQSNFDTPNMALWDAVSRADMKELAMRGEELAQSLNDEQLIVEYSSIVEQIESADTGAELIEFFNSLTENPNEAIEDLKQRFILRNADQEAMDEVEFNSLLTDFNDWRKKSGLEPLTKKELSKKLFGSNYEFAEQEKTDKQDDKETAELIRKARISSVVARFELIEKFKNISGIESMQGEELALAVEGYLEKQAVALQEEKVNAEIALTEKKQEAKNVLIAKEVDELDSPNKDSYQSYYDSISNNLGGLGMTPSEFTEKFFSDSPAPASALNTETFAGYISAIESEKAGGVTAQKIAEQVSSGEIKHLTKTQITKIAKSKNGVKALQTIYGDAKYGENTLSEATPSHHQKEDVINYVVKHVAELNTEAKRVNEEKKKTEAEKKAKAREPVLSPESAKDSLIKMAGDSGLAPKIRNMFDNLERGEANKQTRIKTIHDILSEMQGKGIDISSVDESISHYANKRNFKLGDAVFEEIEVEEEVEEEGTADTENEVNTTTEENLAEPAKPTEPIVEAPAEPTKQPASTETPVDVQSETDIETPVKKKKATVKELRATVKATDGLVLVSGKKTDGKYRMTVKHGDKVIFKTKNANLEKTGVAIDEALTAIKKSGVEGLSRVKGITWKANKKNIATYIESQKDTVVEKTVAKDTAEETATPAKEPKVKAPVETAETKPIEKAKPPKKTRTDNGLSALTEMHEKQSSPEKEDLEIYSGLDTLVADYLKNDAKPEDQKDESIDVKSLRSSGNSYNLKQPVKEIRVETEDGGFIVTGEYTNLPLGIIKDNGTLKLGENLNWTTRNVKSDDGPTATVKVLLSYNDAYHNDHFLPDGVSRRNPKDNTPRAYAVAVRTLDGFKLPVKNKMSMDAGVFTETSPFLGYRPNTTENYSLFSSNALKVSRRVARIYRKIATAKKVLAEEIQLNDKVNGGKYDYKNIIDFTGSLLLFGEKKKSYREAIERITGSPIYDSKSGTSPVIDSAIGRVLFNLATTASDPTAKASDRASANNILKIANARLEDPVIKHVEDPKAIFKKGDLSPKEIKTQKSARKKFDSLVREEISTNLLTPEDGSAAVSLTRLRNSMSEENRNTLGSNIKDFIANPLAYKKDSEDSGLYNFDGFGASLLQTLSSIHGANDMAIKEFLESDTPAETTVGIALENVADLLSSRTADFDHQIDAGNFTVNSSNKLVREMVKSIVNGKSRQRTVNPYQIRKTTKNGVTSLSMKKDDTAVSFIKDYLKSQNISYNEKRLESAMKLLKLTAYRENNSLKKAGETETAYQERMGRIDRLLTQVEAPIKNSKTKDALFLHIENAIETVRSEVAVSKLIERLMNSATLEQASKSLGISERNLLATGLDTANEISNANETASNQFDDYRNYDEIANSELASTEDLESLLDGFSVYQEYQQGQKLSKTDFRKGILESAKTMTGALATFDSDGNATINAHGRKLFINYTGGIHKSTEDNKTLKAGETIIRANKEDLMFIAGVGANIGTVKHELAEWGYNAVLTERERSIVDKEFGDSHGFANEIQNWDASKMTPVQNSIMNKISNFFRGILGMNRRTNEEFFHGTQMANQIRDAFASGALAKQRIQEKASEKKNSLIPTKEELGKMSDARLNAALRAYKRFMASGGIDIKISESNSRKQIERQIQREDMYLARATNEMTKTKAGKKIKAILSNPIASTQMSPSTRLELIGMFDPSGVITKNVVNYKMAEANKVAPLRRRLTDIVNDMIPYAEARATYEVSLGGKTRKLKGYEVASIQIAMQDTGIRDAALGLNKFNKSRNNKFTLKSDGQMRSFTLSEAEIKTIDTLLPSARKISQTWLKYSTEAANISKVALEAVAENQNNYLGLGTEKKAYKFVPRSKSWYPMILAENMGRNVTIGDMITSGESWMRQREAKHEGKTIVIADINEVAEAHSTSVSNVGGKGLETQALFGMIAGTSKNTGGALSRDAFYGVDLDQTTAVAEGLSEWSPKDAMTVRKALTKGMKQTIRAGSAEPSITKTKWFRYIKAGQDLYRLSNPATLIKMASSAHLITSMMKTPALYWKALAMPKINTVAEKYFKANAYQYERGEQLTVADVGDTQMQTKGKHLISGKDTLLAKMRSIPSKADRIAMRTIHMAVALDLLPDGIPKTTASLTKMDGNVAFWDNVASRANMMTMETQPTYESFNRSDLLNRGTFASIMLTRYGTQTSRMLNMATKAYGRMSVDDSPLARDQFERTMTSVLGTNILLLTGITVGSSLLTETVTGLIQGGQDDDDEDYRSSYEKPKSKTNKGGKETLGVRMAKKAGLTAVQKSVGLVEGGDELMRVLEAGIAAYKGEGYKVDRALQGQFIAGELSAMASAVSALGSMGRNKAKMNDPKTKRGQREMARKSYAKQSGSLYRSMAQLMGVGLHLPTRMIDPMVAPSERVRKNVYKATVKKNVSKYNNPLANRYN